MLYGFDTDDQNAATAALCLYAIYRSRNPKRLKVTPDFWGVIERAVRSTAKRATTIPVWIEKLKPKLGCETISPRWAATDAGGLITMLPDPRTGELMQVGGRPKREFLTSIIGEADNKAVLVSIHAPLRGATSRLRSPLQIQMVSIHAPLRGATWHEASLHGLEL